MSINFSPAVDSYIGNILPKMNGWCTPEKATAMIESVLHLRPSFAVEIGVFAGRSLFAIGVALQTIGHGVVLGIEPWEPLPCAQGLPEDNSNRQWWSELDHHAIEKECYDVRAQLGLENHVLLCKSTSAIVFPSIQALSKILGRSPIDFLHIDGNHSEEVSCQDVQGYLPLVRSGGQVWFDDVDWDSTKPAQQLILKECTPIKNWGTFASYLKG
jgi:hypothetical protein